MTRSRMLLKLKGEKLLHKNIRQRAVRNAKHFLIASESFEQWS